VTAISVLTKCMVCPSVPADYGFVGEKGRGGVYGGKKKSVAGPFATTLGIVPRPTQRLYSKGEGGREEVHY